MDKSILTSYPHPLTPFPEVEIPPQGEGIGGSVQIVTGTAMR